MSAGVTAQRQSLRTPKPSAKLRSPSSSMAGGASTSTASEAQSSSATKAGSTAAAASTTSGNTSTTTTNNAGTAAAPVKSEGKTDASKETSNGAAQPLAPPPKPSAVTALSNAGGSTNTPDYFNSIHNNGSTYSLEPNLFDAQFGSGPGETPGKSLLPPVASLTSPSPLTGRESLNGFNWGGGASLRSGPLSPAMLSGPMGGDYFDTAHIRNAFPTPNESSLRTGLTPGGGGSMFPQPSPNTASFLNSLGAATPSTLDFQRTAVNANLNKNKLDALSTVAMSQPQNQNGAIAPRTSAPQETAPDHTQAANGLFLLAQAGNRERNNGISQPDNKPQSGVTTIANAAQRMPSSVAIKQEDDSKNGRGKTATAKKTTPAKGPKSRKSEDLKGQPKKRQRTASMSVGEEDDDDDGVDDDMDDDKVGPDGKKPTDEEKRKNFLERNRVAALKCRQRKKQWLANLQAKVEMFSSDNDMLTQQNQQLKEEILNLKTILIAHKDCPIAQQQQQAGQYISTHANDSYMQHGHPPHAGPYPGNVMAMNMGVGGVGAPGQQGGMMGGVGIRRPS